MNPRQRRGVVLMVLSVLAAFLVFVGVSSYVSNVNSKVGPMVTVYQVTKDLPAFTTLSNENTEPVQVPQRWAADNTVLKSADIDGRVTATPLSAGSPVSLDAMVPPSDLDPSEREIAVNVDAVTGLAGRVRPGDRVEIHLDHRERILEVVRVIDKRVGAPVAAECLVDHSPPPPPRDPLAPGAVRDAGAGRPTKRDRRRLDRIRGR